MKSLEPGEALTNLISLVRFATGQQAELAPFPEQARQRFQDWLTQQETAAGKPFTTEQRNLLAHIAEEIGANAALETDDLDHGTLKSRGGLPRALALFGRETAARAPGRTQHRPRRMNRNFLNPVEFDGFNCGGFATIGDRSR